MTDTYIANKICIIMKGISLPTNYTDGEYNMALLTITDTANDHLSDIIKEHNAKGVMLEIRAGGCAGFAYELII